MNPIVSRETQQSFEKYVTLLLKWNKAINLIGDEKEVWNRHIEDSLQLVELLPSTAKALIDMGSGAGLPGLVIAIATPLEVTLVERDQRKASFLREAARELALPRVRVLAADVKEIGETFDVVTARALAPLDVLCELAAPRMGTNSICLFPKGENFASELEEAQRNWSFEYTAVPSKTSEKSSIVSLSKLIKR